MEDNNINEKRCVLCNKPYNYKYVMFGRGCLDNLYILFNYTQKFDELIKDFQNMNWESI